MARLGRYFLPDQPLHVIQHGNNRGAIFFDEEGYAHYRRSLAEAAAEQGCSIHAYVLMTDHVHLLVTLRRVESLPRLMQSLGRRYVRHVNARHGRSGTLWEGRYRAAPIDSAAYLLACCRYIELNPVRAGMVAHPRDYPWSSWRAHALGAADPLVAPHALYKAAGRHAAGAAEGLSRAVSSGARSGLCRGTARRHQGRLGARRRPLPALHRCPRAARARRRTRREGGLIVSVPGFFDTLTKIAEGHPIGRIEELAPWRWSPLP